MSVLISSGACSSDCGAGFSPDIQIKSRIGALSPDEVFAVKSPFTEYSATAIEESPAFEQSQPLPESPGVPERAKSRNVLIANISWMLVGNVAYGLSQWALLVTLAKIGTIEMVGTFALAMAVVLPVLMFSSLSLRSLQITDSQRLYRFREYASLRAATLILSLLFIFAFELVAGHSAVVVATAMFIGAAKALEYVSDLLYGLLQQQENMGGIAISMSIRAVLSVAGLGVAVSLTHSLVWGAAGLVLASGVVLFGYDIPKTLTRRKGQPAFKLTELVQYLRGLATSGEHRRLTKLALMGLPMGFVMMMVSLNLNIPRFFIERHLGMAELGIFSAIATLMGAGGVVTNAMGQAAAPRMAKYFAEQNKRGFAILLSLLVIASLGLGLLGFAGAFLFGREAMALIYRPEYSTRQEVLIWLMGASGFFYLGSTLGYAVTAVRCFTPQLPLFASSTVATALGCLAFVPALGLRGAALAILISSIVQCAGSARLLYKSCRLAPVLPEVSQA